MSAFECALIFIVAANTVFWIWWAVIMIKLDYHRFKRLPKRTK